MAPSTDFLGLKTGVGDNEYSLGGETVLFRHEKTFVSKTRYAVALCTDMDDAAVEAKLAEIPKVDYERIGERMHVELIYVNCGEGADAAKYTALVEKAAALGRTLVLGCEDPEIAKAALAVCKDSKPRGNFVSPNVELIQRQKELYYRDLKKIVRLCKKLGISKEELLEQVAAYYEEEGL